MKKYNSISYKQVLSAIKEAQKLGAKKITFHIRKNKKEYQSCETIELEIYGTRYVEVLEADIILS